MCLLVNSWGDFVKWIFFGHVWKKSGLVHFQRPQARSLAMKNVFLEPWYWILMSGKTKSLTSTWSSRTTVVNPVFTQTIYHCVMVNWSSTISNHSVWRGLRCHEPIRYMTLKYHIILTYACHTWRRGPWTVVSWSCNVNTVCEITQAKTLKICFLPAKCSLDILIKESNTCWVYILYSK